MGGQWLPEGGWEWEGGSMMSTAMGEAAAALAGVETEWDSEKLEQKLREYFRKGAKGMEFKGKWLEQCINEYADNVMGTLFSAIGDREWFTTGQADLLTCMDAGVKDLFPGKLLKKVKQEEFEGYCLAAYERAFDEQRFWPLLVEAVPAHVTGPKIKKKVQNAIDESRKEAVKAGVATIEEFISTWINLAVKHLSESNFGSPEGTVEPSIFSQLFVALIEAGGLPLGLTQEGQEIPLDLVETTVTASYEEHTMPDEPVPKKKRKGGGGGAWQEEEPWSAFGAGAKGKAGPYGKGGLGGGGGLGVKNPYGKGAWGGGGGGVTPPNPYGKGAGKKGLFGWN